jgi:ABC transporter substrate binding protein
MRRDAAELVALAPDLIVTTGSAATAPVLQETRAIPIVFVQVADPVGGGYVESLPRPGGNGVRHQGKVARIAQGNRTARDAGGGPRDATIAAGAGQLGAIQSIAPAFGVELRPFGVRAAGEIERAVTAFARGSNGGLIALGGAGTTVHRALNIRLAAELRLPAVYPYRYYVIDGGLISYGPNNIDLYRRAAGYSLPLQETHTKF